MTSIDTIVRARSGSRGLAGTLGCGAMLVLAAACSSSSAGTNGPAPATTAGTICQYTVLSQTEPAASCSPAGGEVQGADNLHCNVGAVMGGAPIVQSTGVCVGVPDAATPSGDDTSDANATSDAATAGDGAAVDDAGAVDAGDTGLCGETGYGITNYGTSAADDDCKYDVSWTSTPVCLNGNVYFTVTAKKRAGADGGSDVGPNELPLAGASVSAEVYSDDCDSIAPNSGQTTTEDPAGSGVYKVGPIQFSKSGKWIVRFHFNECCSDDPADSPHGHAAFWINVP
jgi:hypothetical protein